MPTEGPSHSTRYLKDPPNNNGQGDFLSSLGESRSKPFLLIDDADIDSGHLSAGCPELLKLACSLLVKLVHRKERWRERSIPFDLRSCDVRINGKREVKVADFEKVTPRLSSFIIDEGSFLDDWKTQSVRKTSVGNFKGNELRGPRSNLRSILARGPREELDLSINGIQPQIIDVIDGIILDEPVHRRPFRSTT